MAGRMRHPFDAILVTAAAMEVSPHWIAQLKPGGFLVMPKGSQFTGQHLIKVAKNQDGTISIQKILPVLFVPLTGEH